MLDPQALSKLKNLKQDIVASKEFAEGLVASTSGKFGFVRLEDKRDAFLSPEKMQRLLPGDRVKVELLTNERGKIEATVEKILESTLDRFVGRYHVKGAGHFVEPVDPPHNRWIFVPPAHRHNCKDGDYAIATISRHPKTDGKAQAEINDRIGSAEDAYFEKRYVVAKYDLNYQLSAREEQAIKDIEAVTELASPGYEDLSELPFVTIDSEMTRDMDDAVFVETVGDNVLRLHVAIADPASFIARDSTLDHLARRHGQTSYLLGGSIPMLPKALSIGTFSLIENELRRALVSTIDIAPSGEVIKFSIKKALVKSHAKLSYDAVSALITKHCQDVPESRQYKAMSPAIEESVASIDPAHNAPLSALFEVYQRRHQYRTDHQLVTEIGDEMDFKLNDQGKIASVEKRSRHIAHLMVEEAMIVNNIEIANMLADSDDGLHLISGGIRKERIGEARALLRDAGIDTDLLDTAEGLVSLFKRLREAEDQQVRYLQHPLKRMLAFNELSTKASAAASQGLEHYCHFTSPIRRYDDLYNHQAIHSQLSTGASALNKLSDEALTKLAKQIENSRRADHELTRWLGVQYAKQFEGTEDQGVIRVVTQKGFGLRLETIGVDGFVQFTKQDTRSFDTKRMTISTEHQTYKLGDSVKVRIKNVDIDKRRVHLELAD